VFYLGSLCGEGSCPLIGGGQAWLASCLSPASVNPVRARLLLAKQPLEEFRHLHRLRLLVAESLASCWHSRPFGRSWPFWPSTVEIPGTSAGRGFCAWPTRIVIPMTLAPETSRVSWVSMGLRWVLFLAKVYSHPSKSQDPLSGLEVAGLEVKLRGVSPAISGCAGSRAGPALGYSAAASQRPAPQNLNRFGLWTHAATGLSAAV
jgi:hypothetical protein